MQYREALESDLQTITEILSVNNLPSNDCAKHLGNFVVFEANGEIIGIGGMELFRTVALIRSIAVTTEHRKKGLAKKIIKTLEDKAKQKGVKAVYLLTESAVLYFTNQGFSIKDRTNIPVSIMQTQQFKELCPASATVMYKAI